MTCLILIPLLILLAVVAIVQHFVILRHIKEKGELRSEMKKAQQNLFIVRQDREHYVDKYNEASSDLSKVYALTRKHAPPF